MKYIDRKGNITIEENEQDKFLRHLYNDRGGRLCLKLLIRPFVSKAAGVLLNTRLSARFVPDFVKNNKIDLSIYEKQNFSSWNDFFIFAASGTDDFAYSAFKQQIEAMLNVKDHTFRYANNEQEGNLYYLWQKGGIHSGEYAIEYFYNGFCWFWQ